MACMFSWQVSFSCALRLVFRFRLREESDYGMRAHQVEERRLLDFGEQLNLLRRRERGKFRRAWEKLLRLRLQIAQALHISGLIVLRERGERAIDEVYAASLFR